MTTIFLATNDNEPYGKALRTTGFPLVGMPPRIEGYAEIIETVPDEAAWLIIELTSDRLAWLRQSIINNTRLPRKIICLADAPGDAERREILGLGISDLLPPGDPGLVADYISAIAGCRDMANRGRVLAHEKEGPFAKILGSITERYGYELERADNIDGILTGVADRPAELVLINIGTNGFDMAEFVKKAYSSPDIKKYPLVAYKNMEEGLFVHEITTGLNRLTRTIHSLDELLNLLITLFHKSETGPLVNAARALLDADGPAGADASTLRRLFYAEGPDLCVMTSLLDAGRFAKSLEAGAALHRSILKTAGLLWMITPPRECPTCGGGV